MLPTTSTSTCSQESSVYLCSKSSISSQVSSLSSASKSGSESTHSASFHSAINCSEQALVRIKQADECAEDEGGVINNDHTTIKWSDVHDTTESSAALHSVATNTLSSNGISVEDATPGVASMGTDYPKINDGEAIDEYHASVTEPDVTRMTNNDKKDGQLRLTTSSLTSSDGSWSTFIPTQEKPFGRTMYETEVPWTYDAHQQSPKHEGIRGYRTRGCGSPRPLVEAGVRQKVLDTGAATACILSPQQRAHKPTETYALQSARVGRVSQRTSCSSGRSASYYGSRSGSSRNSTPHKSHDSKATPNSPNSIGTFSEAPVCRICYGGDAEELLVSPCYCAGSMGLLHVSCLQQWLGSSNKSSCEICHFQFTLHRRTMPISHFFKNPGTVTDRRNLRCDVIAFLLITPMTIITAWMCMIGASDYYANDPWGREGLTGLSICLLVLYSVWVLIALRHNIRLWRDWSMFHQDVTLQGTPAPDPPTRGRTLPPNNSGATSQRIQRSRSTGSRSTVGSVQLQGIKISVQGPFNRSRRQHTSRPKKLCVGRGSSPTVEPGRRDGRLHEQTALTDDERRQQTTPTEGRRHQQIALMEGRQPQREHQQTTLIDSRRHQQPALTVDRQHQLTTPTDSRPPQHMTAINRRQHQQMGPTDIEHQQTTPANNPRPVFVDRPATNPVVASMLGNRSKTLKKSSTHLSEHSDSARYGQVKSEHKQPSFTLSSRQTQMKQQYLRSYDPYLKEGTKTLVGYGPRLQSIDRASENTTTAVTNPVYDGSSTSCSLAMFDGSSRQYSTQTTTGPRQTGQPPRDTHSPASDPPSNVESSVIQEYGRTNGGSDTSYPAGEPNQQEQTSNQPFTDQDIFSRGGSPVEGQSENSPRLPESRPDQEESNEASEDFV